LAPPPEAAASPPPLVAGYEVLSELGRGGMGVVYRARQKSLNRVVALKMVLTGAHAGPDQLARFRAEAEALARLRHPHIVQVYDVGEQDGRPYFAMELVEGGDLAGHLSGTPLPPRPATQLAELLARALNAAHQEGLVHRDIKPANILLVRSNQTHAVPLGGGSSRPEEAGHYEPKITDFGLAKQLDSPTSKTQSGAVVGTPSYGAPEQVGGKGRLVGPAADVYSLGTILYEMLVGRPPFKAATMMDTVMQVLTEEPVPPRRLQSKVPRDLETICLKCLQKEPAKRYASAEALADDLRRFLDGQPIVARPVSRTERAIKWARRRPAVAALIGISILALLVLVGGGIWADRRAREQRAVALVESLKTAETAAVPRLVQDLGPYRRWADPLLRRLATDAPADSKQRLHAALALMPVDPWQAEPLSDALLKAGPEEVLVIRAALLSLQGSQKDQLNRWLWEQAEGADPARLLPVAGALAVYDPHSSRWPTVSRDVAIKLVSENPLYLGRWTEALRPVRAALLGPLGELFRDGSRTETERLLATTVLVDYAADRPDVLADLLQDADPRQFAKLFPHLRAHGEEALAVLRQALAQEMPPDKEVTGRERLARRQANAAVALLRLGEDELVWPLLRHTPDPSRRSYLLHALGRLGTDPGVLLRRLEAEADVSARRALILSLGEYTDQQLSAGRRPALVRRLLDWYRDDPDAGIHSALDWLLRHGQCGPAPRKLDWGQADTLARIDRERAGQPPGKRDWYVTREGHTLAVIRNPEVFLMGSPASDPERLTKSESPAHRVRIPRSFAVGTKEVTVAQFKRFLEANPQIGRQHRYAEHYSPDAEGGIVGVTWFEAAAYCNWLSEQEGIPEEEWCYPKDLRDGVQLAPDLLRRKGYRLPTEAEWEYACRAGATTSRFFGASAALMEEYAWFYKNSEDRAWPGGQLKPNDRGLFDVYGNVLEWCHDWIRMYRLERGDQVREDGDKQDLVVSDTKLFARVLRGGSFGSRTQTLRSATRMSDVPGRRFDSVGFRVARTLE
jgi:formylglycine-generating enzyme required for sulfatase activity